MDKRFQTNRHQVALFLFLIGPIGDVSTDEAIDRSIPIVHLTPPGDVVHVHSDCSAYKAVHVPRINIGND